MCCGNSQVKIMDNGDGDVRISEAPTTISPRSIELRSKGTVPQAPPTQVLQSEVVDGGNGAGAPQCTDLNASGTPIASPISSVYSSQNVEARSSTSRKGTAPPSIQSSQSGVIDNGDGPSQRKDPSIHSIHSTPSPASSGSRVQNIVVLGPTGGGVSSVFNLITGKDVTPVSNDTRRCTTEATAYPIELGNVGGVIQCTLYDIPGFDSSPPTLPSGNINLAIVCMEDRTPQVKEAIGYLDHWANHDGCNTPVLVVINHMTPHPDPDWWKTNEEHFADLRLVVGHVCLTRKKRSKNTEELRSLITEFLSRRI